jgi:tetratricopeptide (TPR) repeat protein
MTHYTDDQWLEYAGGSADPAEAVVMDEHLGTCLDCRSMYDDAENLQSALEDAGTWEVCAVFEESDAAPPAELRALAQRIDDERKTAEEHLRSALASTAAFAAANVAEDGAHATSATVEVLTAAARAVRQRQPPFAVSLAAAATTIGGRLAREGRLRGNALFTYAWIERAAALFFCGRYREASQCLDAAAPLIEDAHDRGAAELDRAIVELLYATICAETERLDEASARATVAAGIFSELGDERNAIGAKLITGTVAFFRNDYAGAVAIYEELVSRARASAETTALAHALASAAAAYVKLARYDRAEAYFLEVLPLWTQLGFDLNRLRAEWILAVARGYQQQFGESIPALYRTIAELESLGAMHDGAVARLDLADVLSLAGRTAEIVTVIDGVVPTFASENITGRANYAVSFLRDALLAGNADLQLIRHVREYMNRLASHPEAEFQPPS